MNISDSYFDFDIYIVQLLESDNEENRVKNIIDTYKKYCKDSVENKESLMKLFSTYLCGDLDEGHSKKAIKDIENLLSNDDNNDNNNDNNNNENYNDINELFKSWTDIFKDYELSKKIEILNLLLSNIEKKSFKITKLIWSFSEFRELINHMPLYESGKKFVEKGIFRTLFSNSQNKSNYLNEKTLDSVIDLINDESLHPFLVKYMHSIIKSNEAYLSLNYETNILQKKCSKIDFNLFALKFMKKLHDLYFKNKNKDELFNNLSLEIKDFEIDNLELSQQMYVTMLYGMHVLLSSFYKLYDIYRGSNKNFISIIKKEINEYWVQDMFIEYDKYHNNFNIENMYIDIVIYYDFIYSYIKKDKFNIIIKTPIYRIISEILGGKAKNIYTRYMAFTVIKSYANEIGFLVFDNFFDNLFKYINELNLDKLGFFYLKDKVVHQHAITNTLFQMTDFCKEINDKSKYIFPETIYKMIDNSFSIFDNFDDELYDKIEINILARKQYKELYIKAIQMCLYTLLVYENIYDKKIIDQIYPEIEEKYLLFIGRIISNINMKPGNNFIINQKKNNSEDFEVALIEMCVNIIKKKIKNKSDAIVDIKEKILNYLPHFKNCILNNKDKDNIKIELENYYKFDETDYPSEFLDPITFKPIVTPIMIPNISEIFERVSVVTQIYSQGINPYTREPLSLEELEKYNQREDTIQKINQFNKQKEKWTSEQMEKEKKNNSESINESMRKSQE